MRNQSKPRQQLSEEFLDALKRGQLPWKACWQQMLPVNAVSGKTYRGVNRLRLTDLAEERGYSDPRWCTYLQAQQKGWQVMKGSKGVPVEYWAYYDTLQKKLLKWPEAVRLVRQDPTYEQNLVLRCRTSVVFNAKQISGIPPLEANQTNIDAIRQQRDTLLKNMEVGYQEGGDSAYYDVHADRVVLPPESTFDDTYSYLCTFLHECGHASGHESRLNRDLSGEFGSESYAKEELRVEIASAFAAQEIGLQLTDAQLEQHMQRHLAYVQNWAQAIEDAPNELFAAIRDADRISDYLIMNGEFLPQQMPEQAIRPLTAMQAPTPDPAAEPTVTIVWSESAELREGETMPLSRANALFASLDEAELASPGYAKTEFTIDFVMNGTPNHYSGRQDLGDGDGNLIDHIEKYHTDYINNEDWENYLLRNKGKEGLVADKERRTMLLREFVPYLQQHCNLSELERTAGEALKVGDNLPPAKAAYYTAVQAYTAECRGLLNQGKYNLPPVPQLKDFDEEIVPEAAQTSAPEQPETSVTYYPIDENAARRAKEATSFSDYEPGSATAVYRQYVDEAADLAAKQKKRVDPSFHERIDGLLDAYARKLAANMNRGYEITARVPSIMITGGSKFPVRKKEEQNIAADKNMREFAEIQGLLGKIRSTGMGGISADDPNAISKLESKLAELESLQETMKSVNAYYFKNKTLDGCPYLSPEQIEKMKASMSRSRQGNPKPFENYELSNNNAEIHRLKDRITDLTHRKELGYVGWEFDGGRVEANATDNRLQIFFDEKPDKEIREELKENGFRYAPSAGAWQRQLNDNAIYAANRIKCVHPSTGESPTELQKQVRQKATSGMAIEGSYEPTAMQLQEPPPQQMQPDIDLEP